MYPRQQICAILHLDNCLLRIVRIVLFQRCASDLKDGEDGREGEEGGGQRKGEHKKEKLNRMDCRLEYI